MPSSKRVFLLAHFTLCAGCSLDANVFDLQLASQSASIPLLSVTGAHDTTPDLILKGSVEPTLSWTPVPDAGAYRVTILENDGVTVKCSETTTALTTHDYSGCALVDRSVYLARIAPQISGVWQAAYELISFTVDALNLVPRDSYVLTGDTVQVSAEYGTGPFTFEDGGAGFIHPTTGLITTTLGTSPQTLTLSVLDSLGSSNSTSLRIRSFSDLAAHPHVDKQLADYTLITDMVETSSGALLAVVDTLNSPWMNTWASYRSVDGGATWNLVDHYQGAYTGENIAYEILEAANEDILVCGEGWEADTFWILRRSQDNGITWSDVENTTTIDPDGAYGCHSLAKSPTTNTVLAVGDIGNNLGIRRSVDHGETWNGLPEITTAFSPRPKVRAASNGHFFILNTRDGATYRSTDDGLTWTLMGTIASHVSRDFAVLADNVTLVSVGSRTATISGLNGQRWSTYRSTNAGVNWSEVDYQPGGPNPQWIGLGDDVSVLSDGTIWVAGNQRQYTNSGTWTATGTAALARKSLDGGTTWSDGYQLFGGGSFRRLTRVLERNDGTLLAALWDTSPGGAMEIAQIEHSTDDGATWSRLSSFSFLQVFYLDSYDFEANTSGRLIMTGETYDERMGEMTGIVRVSLDRGQTWLSGLDLFDPAMSSGGQAVAVDGAGNFYAAMAQIDWSGTDPNRMILKKSTDGVTWTDLNTWALDPGEKFFVNEMIVDTDGSLMTAGRLRNPGTGKDEAFTRRISSAGTELHFLSEPPADGSATRFEYWDLAKAPDGTWWAVGEEQVTFSNRFWIVKKSTDGGQSWTLSEAYQPSPGQRALAKRIAIASDGTLFVMGTDITGTIIRKSEDDGGTWAPLMSVPSGTSGFGDPTDLHVDNDENLFLTTSRSDWETTDGGSVWKIRSDGSRVEVDRFQRSLFHESNLMYLRNCGPTLCAAGEANSPHAEGKRFLVRELSP